MTSGSLDFLMTAEARKIIKEKYQNIRSVRLEIKFPGTYCPSHHVVLYHITGDMAYEHILRSLEAAALRNTMMHMLRYHTYSVEHVLKNIYVTEENGGPITNATTEA